MAVERAPLARPGRSRCATEARPVEEVGSGALKRACSFQVLILGLLLFQLSTMALHARSHDSHHAAVKAAQQQQQQQQQRGTAAQGAQGTAARTTRLSDAEEALLSRLASEPERLFARETRRPRRSYVKSSRKR